ncbi:MAG: HIRAN domain-containing protein [Anaerovoracaceae bacterium]|jgi:hypothetical protein
MANELSRREKQLAATASEHELGELIKPLTREIYLFDTYVAGTTHLLDQSVLTEIQVGDKLSLQRENNKFDEKAILIFTEKKKKLGYIPEKDNVVFSRLMDAGKLLSAKIREINNKGSFTQICINIYLIDF